MGNPNSPLTKICKSCGLAKPLSAFLQLAGTYSNVCAACRTKNKKAQTIDAGEGTHELDLRLDAEKILESAVNEEQNLKKREELYEEEREKNKELEAQQTQKTEQTTQDEKQRAKSYFERSSFLGTKTEVGKSATTQAAERAAEKAHGIEQAVKQEQVTREEKKLTELDTTAPYIDTHFGQKQKFGDAAQTLARQTGVQGGVKTAIGSTLLGRQPAPSTTHATTEQKDKKADKGSLPEYVAKTWGRKR